MVNNHDEQYLKLVQYTLDNGARKPNRTGVDTLSVFGYQMRFNLRDGTIPLLTTKKMHTRSIIREILWYFQGGDNVKYLQEHNVTIWDEWAKEDGSLGPVYGYQWRKWPTFTPISWETLGFELSSSTGLLVVQPGEIDQVKDLVNRLKTSPNDRRMIVNAWNVADLSKMALPPCHRSFQCWTRPVGDKLELSLQLDQRSCDIGLGVPFNIVQYSIILRMLCEVVDMIPGELIWNGGDVHIYVNHVDQLREQLTRVPYDPPTFSFSRKVSDIDDFKFEDFVIEGYQSHPTIKMDVAV